MKVFKVNGKFRMGRRRTDWQPFSKEVIADSEEEAKENLYSLLGSKHRVKRTNIKVFGTEEVPEDEVEDFVIQDRLSKEE